jgi:quinol-cytochrome oxidoreductase complex cytochrome b subunit
VALSTVEAGRQSFPRRGVAHRAIQVPEGIRRKRESFFFLSNFALDILVLLLFLLVCQAGMQMRGHFLQVPSLTLPRKSNFILPSWYVLMTCPLQPKSSFASSVADLRAQTGSA